MGTVFAPTDAAFAAATELASSINLPLTPELLAKILVSGGWRQRRPPRRTALLMRSVCSPGRRWSARHRACADPGAARGQPPTC